MIVRIKNQQKDHKKVDHLQKRISQKIKIIKASIENQVNIVKQKQFLYRK
jgi:hypothetical protein